MKTKLLYILSSSSSDTFSESALISIYSARYRMKEVNITLLVDDITQNYLIKESSKILEYITELVVVSFEESTDLFVRSRLLKTNMRNHIKGDFLYIDCDTLVTSQLYEIEMCKYDIAGVLDGHVTVKKHPVSDIFKMQSKVFNFPFENITNYYSSGVMYVKDSPIVYRFFEAWHENYKLGLKKGLRVDEPSLAKTNYSFSNVMGELPGEWNCQIRLGALFLKDVKILHFWSKRNMPVSSLGSKDFLIKIKEEGLEKYKESIINYQMSFYEPMGLIVNSDLYFNFSSLYEQSRSHFIAYKEISYFKNGLFFIEKADKNIGKSILISFFMSLNRILFKVENWIIVVFTKAHSKS